MPKYTLESLGRLVREKRGELGVRAVAKEIQISAATLSRVERGYLPDLERFQKICKWLEISPSDILGFDDKSKNDKPTISAHFRKNEAIKPETAQALAELILAAQRALMVTNDQ